MSHTLNVGDVGEWNGIVCSVLGVEDGQVYLETPHGSRIVCAETKVASSWESLSPAEYGRRTAALSKENAHRNCVPLCTDGRSVFIQGHGVVELDMRCLNEVRSVLRTLRATNDAGGSLTSEMPHLYFSPFQGPELSIDSTAITAVQLEAVAWWMKNHQWVTKLDHKLWKLP